MGSLRTPATERGAPVRRGISGLPAAVIPGVVPALAAAVAVAALAATVLLHVRHPDALVTLLPSTDMYELHVDFDTFWQSAVALVHGADLYDTPAKLTNLNPPVLTVLLVPFAALDALTAYRLFAVLTLAMVAVVMAAVARELRLGPWVAVAAVAAVLASSPLHGTLVLGQIYGLLLVGLVAGWIAERRGHPVLAACCYGITVALKPSLAPILLLPLAQRRWVPLRAGLAAAAATTLAGMLLAGPSATWEWFAIALTEAVPGVEANASLPGLAARFGVPTPVGSAVGLLLLAGTLLWCARHRSEIDPAGTAPWAVLAAALLFSPIAWHNYLLLLMPGALVVAAQGRRLLAAALLAASLVPVSWGAEWAPDEAVPLSLYSAILLGWWLVLLATARRGAQPPSGTSQSTPAGGSRSVAEADRPCQEAFSATTTPRFPTPEPP
jgi:arabinofuranan 3-O-arabinosyltransferase